MREVLRDTKRFIGERFVILGLKLMGYDNIEALADEKPDDEPEEEGPQPMPAVTLSPEAMEMRRSGHQHVEPPVVEEPPPLKGSARERYKRALGEKV